MGVRYVSFCYVCLKGCIKTEMVAFPEIIILEGNIVCFTNEFAFRGYELNTFLNTKVIIIMLFKLWVL